MIQMQSPSLHLYYKQINVLRDSTESTKLKEFVVWLFALFLRLGLHSDFPSFTTFSEETSVHSKDS